MVKTLDCVVYLMTVSTVNVNSDSIIMMTAEAATRQSSGIGQPFEVTSIVSATSFDVTTADGIALVRDTTIQWMVIRRS